MYVKRGIVGVSFAAVLATSCLDPSEGIKEALIDPANPDELSQVLIIPDSERDQGDPPDTTGDPDTPTVSNIQASASLNAGEGQVVLSFNFNSMGVGVGVGGLYVQVIGASDFFDIPIGNMTESGEALVPVELPSNVADGVFGLSYCIYDNADLVSQVIETTMFVTSATCDDGEELCVGCEEFCFTICPMGGCPDICAEICPTLCACTSAARGGGGTVNLAEGFDRGCCTENGLMPVPDTSVMDCQCPVAAQGDPDDLASSMCGGLSGVSVLNQ